MRRILVPVILVAVALVSRAATPGALEAQSSQLSVSGLGIPGRGVSTRSWTTGGARALFDGESSTNPASLARVGAVTAVFTGLQDFRRIENPAGEASTRGTRFPHFSVAGGVRGRPYAFGLSYSSYATRDYTFGIIDTVQLRDVPVEVGDTFSSRGGLGDIRLGAAYRLGASWSVGAGLHVMTGSNRLQIVRGFADPAYVSTRQRAEIGYAGVGVSLGVLGQLAPTFAVAATARSDGHLSVTRNLADAGTIDLPYSLAGGFEWSPSTKLDLGGQVTARTWSAANSDLLARGEAGAKNTVELAFGGEFVPDPRRPFRRPLRFGIRSASLPFLLSGTQEQPREVGVSIGSGARFAAQRAGIDVGLERLWRSAGAYTESAWIVSVGVSVRP